MVAEQGMDGTAINHGMGEPLKAADFDFGAGRADGQTVFLRSEGQLDLTCMSRRCQSR